MEKYSRVKQLGKGSFGAAFLVKRIRDGGLFVVKEVSLAKMTSKEKDEARHEVKVLSQLSHPNITQYTEHSERNGILSIVMEYADGGDLYQRIKASAAAKYSRNRAAAAAGGGKGPDESYEGMLRSKGPGASGMSEELMMHFFAQICLATDYLHSKHILHRDIKSMNVFLTSRGTVKLGDFGISTILRNTIGMAKTVCGTPYYFSPELCRSKPYNNKSDVWALGIVLYEMANVKHPFDASSMTALMQRICRGSYVQLPTAPAGNPSLGFSKGLNSLIARCLDVNVGTRYNIKQVLATDILRQALARLEKDLMLATVCKVRLQTVIGHFDQREPSSYAAAAAQPQPSSALPAIGAPQNAQNPSAFPNPNRLAPKPIPIPIPIVPARQQPAPVAAAQPQQRGVLPVRSEAVQVQREIDKVDKLIAYLKQPTPGGGPYKVAPQPPPPSGGQQPNPRAPPRDKDEAANEYIRKHQELQQIMAAHKKKVEDNLRRRQEQEEAYHKEALARRHQYQIDHRPPANPKPSPAPPSALPAPSPPQAQQQAPAPPAAKAAEVKLPPIASKPKVAAAANCLPAANRKTRQAAAAEAWAAEQKRQDERKKAAAEERRAKGRADPSSAAAAQGKNSDDVQGIGEYFDRRRREQQEREVPQPGGGRADMPAGVQARRQLLGERADASPTPSGGSPQPSPPSGDRSKSPAVPRPKALSPLAIGGQPLQAEPPAEKPPSDANRRPSVGRQSQPRELPPVTVPQKRPAAAGIASQDAVNAHVRAVEAQLRALGPLAEPPKVAAPSPPQSLSPPTTTLSALVHSFARRGGDGASHVGGANDGRAREEGKEFAKAPEGPPPAEVEDDEDDEEEAAAQTLRQKDYGNMLKHIQGLNVMLGEVDRRRQLLGEAADAPTRSPRSPAAPSCADAEEEVVTEVVGGPRSINAHADDNEDDNGDDGDFVEEDVVDTSCYIGRGRRGRAEAEEESSDSDSDGSSSGGGSGSEVEVDTILDATVRGAVATTDFADVEPLTPSRRKAAEKRPSAGAGAAPLAFGDDDAPPSSRDEDTDVFRLAHLCGHHFEGTSPVLLDGRPLLLPDAPPPSHGRPSSDAADSAAEKAAMRQTAAALHRYLTADRFAALVSEEAVTPRDKPAEGPRYRREASAFAASLVCRLLSSIGAENEGGAPSAEADARDDAALDAARAFLQLLHQVPVSGASPSSVALTALLSAARRSLPQCPTFLDDRRDLAAMPAAERAEVLSGVDAYVRGLCTLIAKATGSDGARSVAVAVDGDDAYCGDSIAEMIALVAQYLYYKG